MGYLDDYGNPLDMAAPLPASSSPGLDSLPAEGNPAPAQPPTADESNYAPVTDLSTQATPSLALAPQPAAPSSGLGLARNADTEYLKSLPTAQKIGLMLEAFGNGVTGRPNPVTELLANRRKQEAEFRAELGTTLKTIEAGIHVVKATPPGKARDALVEQIVRAAGSQGMDGGVIGSALKSAGSNDEKDLQDIVATLQDPAARDMVIKAAMKSDNPRKEALRLITDSDFRKNLEKVADQNNLPKATALVNVFSKALKQMPGMVDENGQFSMATLIEQNNKAAPTLKIPDAVIGTIQRNQAAFIPYGLKTDVTAQAEQSAGGRVGTQYHTDAAKARADYAKGNITLDDLNTILKGKENKIVIQQQTIDKGKQAASTATGTELTPEAIDQAAQRYRVDGTLPPNLGRGNQSAANTSKILNKAAEAAAAEGKTGEADRIRQLVTKADSAALAQLTKQEATTSAFEKNAIANAKIALDMSEKVGRTGVPVLNRWLVAGMKEVAGDPDVAKFHAANETFVNEYAKIMSGSMGNTVVSDSLRREIHTMLSTASTPEQYKQVVGQMKVEMGNRMKGFSDTRSEITSRMSSKAGAASAPSASAPLPVPTDKSQLVRGKKYQTQRGVATWNGTAFEQ